MAPILANLLFVLILLAAFGLQSIDPDRFYRIAQEDEVLEWATFWAFVLAAVAHARAALAERRGGLSWPWFSAGVAAFCVLVAMEEISWGQRLLGYRSPEYFLAHNFQQELNLHNVADDWLRQSAFMVIVIGYGVVLGLALLQPVLRSYADRLGIVAPPLWLAPGFAATAIVYEVYPWTFAGEWAEAMLGLGMLCAGLAIAARWPGSRGEDRAHTLARSIAVQTVLSLALGTATAWLWFAMVRVTPAHLEAARVELEALRDDYSLSKSRTRCGVHKRVHSHVVKYDVEHLYEGRFASLVGAGLPEDRARYFLDPWNSPYWIKHKCAEDGSRRAILVYSFGPNRHRDSTDWTVEPDDLASWVSRPSSERGRAHEDGVEPGAAD